MNQSTNFPSFSEGLSLREKFRDEFYTAENNFPSFSEGLSLRGDSHFDVAEFHPRFPFLFGGTFIEGVEGRETPNLTGEISLPFRRDFH